MFFNESTRDRILMASTALFSRFFQAKFRTENFPIKKKTLLGCNFYISTPNFRWVSLVSNVLGPS